MNPELYLKRIGHDVRPTASLAALKQMQKSHLLSVPFENLDIHYGVPIRLEIDSIFGKVIENKRGGFCYELNGLFFELLTALGFVAKRISARVYNTQNGEYGYEYDHMAVVVKLDGKEYLTDVGFGEFAFGPLALEPGRIQTDERGEFMLDNFEKDYLRVSKIENGDHRPEYIFRNIHRELHEFSDMCLYHQTSPESHFTRSKLISIPTENGRISLTSTKLKIKNHDLIEETEIKDEAEFERQLWELFKLRLEKKTAGTHGGHQPAGDHKG
jgi:N-hydroxyarylamine O-acetyltransferase